MGRQLQEVYGQKPQVVITMPILEGLDGVQKMSKSLNNYIGIADSAEEMFGKIMSISDQLMWRYFELLSFRPLAEVKQWEQNCQAGENPRQYKVQLAQEIITRFHNEAAAIHALESFEARFQRGAMPEDIEEICVAINGDTHSVTAILKEAGLTASTSEAMRMINQGAVKIDGEKVTDPKIMLRVGSQHVYQVGKRKFARVTII